MTSKEFMQNVAFAIIEDRDVDGTELYMPKMIRTTQKSELISLCKNFLQDQNLPVPADGTLYRYLASMPAGTQKIMKGINPFQESAMSSLENLKSIVKRLMLFNIGEETGKQLLKSLSTAHTYIR